MDEDIVYTTRNGGKRDNHSIAYCLLGYMCAYFRYYYPTEFITAFLNNAANDEDIANGTALARLYGINVTSPKFGISQSTYSCSPETKTIAKGMASIKFMSDKASKALYEMSQQRHYELFSDLLFDIKASGCIDQRQIDILVHIDFFSQFGNQRELERIIDVFSLFKDGEAKQIRKEKVRGTIFEEIVRRHSIGETKSGKESANYSSLDTRAIIMDCEEKIKSIGVPDLGLISKATYFAKAMGYSGYTTGKDTDRPKLFVRDIYPLKRKKDGVQFGYSVVAQSIGSGIETRYTIRNFDFNNEPIDKGDIIMCTGWKKDRGYYTITGYYKIYPGDEEDET